MISAADNYMLSQSNNTHGHLDTTVVQLESEDVTNTKLPQRQAIINLVTLVSMGATWIPW